MRRIALASLFAATGCNWVFGLTPTVAIDAAPVSELPPGPRTRLVWAVATTDGMLASGIDPLVEYRPIGSEALNPDPPTVLVGDDTNVTPAAYDMTDGSFEIPYPLRESPHRIVYTLPGDSVPHEVQWALTGAVLVVPRTTRADAPKPPANSGYKVTPSGLASAPTLPAAFTSGVFTATDDVQQIITNGPEITLHYASGAKPLAGPTGAPQAAKGDWLLLTSSTISGARRYVDGWAQTSVELMANTMVTPATQPPWQTTQRTLSTGGCPANCLPQGNASATAQRLTTTLGSLGGTVSYAMAYGASPSTDLQGFLPGTAPTYLERPLMLSFLTSTQLDATINLADPTASLGLARVLFMRVATTRDVGGLALTSAIQTVTNVFAQGAIQYPAPLAISIQLGQTSLASEQSDGAPVPASSGRVALTFETEAGYSADDFVITLYEITGTTLAPVRVYHVIQPSVSIDGNLLVAGHSYVFGITARTGFGGADRGDYQKATYPFGSTTTFARTFVVQ
jgi:hypothetical protein